MGKATSLIITPDTKRMESENIDLKIQQKVKKSKKNQSKGNAVNLFGNAQEKNEKDTQNQNLDNEDDMDYFITDQVVNTDGANNRDNMNTNVNDNVWEENTKVIEYTEEPKMVEEAPKKKKIGWGDDVKQTAKVAEINPNTMFFPDLNDNKAEEKAQALKEKEKKEVKNQGLFRGTGDDSNAGGNWGSNATKTNKFSENDDAIRFTNSKGNAEKLNKFMVREGPTYDDTLGENVEAKEDVNGSNTAPVQFKIGGKLKINSEASEADRQREAYLKEVQERAQLEEVKRAEQKESRAEDKPRFTNSKASGVNSGLFMSNDTKPKNNGLMMNGAANHQQNKENKEEKPRFTNSKKVNTFVEPALDPNVPTVTA